MKRIGLRGCAVWTRARGRGRDVRAAGRRRRRSRGSAAPDTRQSIGVTLGGFFVTREDSRVDGGRAGRGPVGCAAALVRHRGLQRLLLRRRVARRSRRSTSRWASASGITRRPCRASTATCENANGGGDRAGAEAPGRPGDRRPCASSRSAATASQPYIGGGIGAFNWRYSESGEFVDTSDDSIFRNTYVAKGWTAGPVVLGGIRFPVGDAFTIGGEVRWQRAEGDTDRDETGLLGDKIDLGGWNAAVTFHFRF